MGYTPKRENYQQKKKKLSENYSNFIIHFILHKDTKRKIIRHLEGNLTNKNKYN